MMINMPPSIGIHSVHKKYVLLLVDHYYTYTLLRHVCRVLVKFFIVIIMFVVSVIRAALIYISVL